MAIVDSTEIRSSGVKRLLYGHIHTLDTGIKVYVARRKRAAIFRGGKFSISGATTEGVASWAIDESLIISLRAKGVAFVGVREEDTGDLYLTRLEVFFNRKLFKVRDYTGVGRGGSRQRYVSLECFTVRRGVAKLDGTLY